MESLALPVLRAGHMPVLGEWMALPLVQAAGSHQVGDDVFKELFHPIAIRLLAARAKLDESEKRGLASKFRARNF
jgi:hypothetical protein